MRGALDGIESLKPRVKPVEKAVPVKKKTVIKKPVEPDEVEDTPLDDGVVRVPRTTPSSKTKQLEALVDGDVLLKRSQLAVKEHTQERREQVLAWLLNGHMHEGKVLSVSEFAVVLDVSRMTLERDIAEIKAQMAEFHTTEDLRDVPALAHMLMEMKFQDRGRALALYNIIMKDIDDADLLTKVVRDGIAGGEIKPGKHGVPALTGRDRAAMYAAALSALDLSNKATNGMDQLFKLTGGAQRLQTIIKAKNVQINNGPIMTRQQLQEFAAQELGHVLPSNRKVNAQLQAPKILDLTDEDKAIMDMGGK